VRSADRRLQHAGDEWARALSSRPRPVADQRTTRLFVSGDAEVSGYEHDPDMLAVPRLVKPFSLGDLFSAVTRALETQSHVGL
jgi:hypothetical protein